jgi:hypothetical protein
LDLAVATFFISHWELNLFTFYLYLLPFFLGTFFFCSPLRLCLRSIFHIYCRLLANCDLCAGSSVSAAARQEPAAEKIYLVILFQGCFTGMVILFASGSASALDFSHFFRMLANASLWGLAFLAAARQEPSADKINRVILFRGFLPGW